MSWRKAIRMLAGALALCLPLALAGGCGQKDGPLSQKQLDKATAMLADMYETENGRVINNGMNLYHSFIPDYDRPQDLPLARVLTYFCTKEAEYLGDKDAEEFHALLDLPGWGYSKWNEEENRLLLPDDLPVPTRRIPEEAVDAFLKEWLGIGWRDVENRENVLYLEEYHAFYNTTSDAMVADFVCVKGEREGDTVRLWSQPVERFLSFSEETQTWEKEEKCRRLTLKQRDGKWYIHSFHWVDPTELEQR